MLNDTVDQRGKALSIAKCTVVDVIEDGCELRIKLVLRVQMGVTEVLDIFGKVTKEEDVLFADFAGDFNLKSVSCCLRQIEPRILTFAPSQVPMIKPPFKQNFMLLVPLASVPAVEMCSLMSLAGQIISALLTL